MFKLFWLLLSSLAVATSSFGSPTELNLDQGQNSYHLSVEGRSIADHCRYIYRIESEFRWQIELEEAEALADQMVLVTWLFDLYEGKLMQPEFNELEMEGGKIRVETSLVTMSTNPKYLAHEKYFTITSRDQAQFAEPQHKINFSGLMRRCYDWPNRGEAPFVPLTIVPAPSP